tara:strand:+ start:66 stop:707 length:642 start_codon:yes stop_codon:yes gene_type:complete
MAESTIQITRPFGPSIAKAVMPKELVDKLNKYVDDILDNKEKSKKQDWGHKLVGHVKQEFKLENDFIDSSGFMNFLSKAVSAWIKNAEQKQITKFLVHESWVVRQFKNDFNPIHWHSGHVSGVGYLKLPKTFGKLEQGDKKGELNKLGRIELIHGNKMFLQKSTFSIVPEVGSFYFFPNYMMHTVYPFKDSDEERRSISFNANIDENIYDVYR